MHNPHSQPIRFRQLFRAALSSFWRTLPWFLSYQVWTKLLFSGLLLPAFWVLVRVLMMSGGMHVITNRTLAEFMLRKEGILLAAVALFLIFMGIVLELFGFVTLSARALHDAPEAGYRSLVLANLKLIPKLVGPGGLLLVLYLLIFVPLSGAGVGLSFISVRIPSFITQVIESNPLYLGIYLLLLLVMLLISVRWIFALHFIVIGRMRALPAMRASARLYRQNRGAFLKAIALFGVLGIAAAGILVVLWSVGVYFLIESLDFSKASARGLLMGMFLLQTLSGFLVAILMVPFDVHVLTLLFYRFTAADPAYAPIAAFVPEAAEKRKLSPVDRLFRNRRRFVAVALLGIAGIAALSQGLFSEFFRAPYATQIIAHRGGGFSAPENSVSGLRYAILHGADYTEVDVQRTKDGAYVLNHDTTLKRALGINRRTEDLTLQEIQAQPLQNGAETEEFIPELNEFLDIAKGRIRIMLELKGRTADEKMAEEIIALIRSHRMENDIVLTSLNDSLIRYIEQEHPDILTGFIYFLTYGDVTGMEADYLILEEGAATQNRIADIAAAGKKSVVWTVNQSVSMQTFIERGADAIITDEIRLLREQIAIEEAKTLQDRLTDFFLPK